MNKNIETVADYVEVNRADLEVLGLFFCNLIRTDYCIDNSCPSPVLAKVMELSKNGELGTKKSIDQLMMELGYTNLEFLVEGNFSTILRQAMPHTK